jgi:hypothetical protein
MGDCVFERTAAVTESSRSKLQMSLIREQIPVARQFNVAAAGLRHSRGPKNNYEN